MNEFTRPAAVLGYVNTAGLIGSAIYLNNKTTALSVKINNVEDRMKTVEDGIKEEFPMMKSSVKSLDHGLRSVANAVNTLGPIVKKQEKTGKKVDKLVQILSDIGEAVELLEIRQNALISALNAAKVLENFTAPSEVPRPVVHKKKSSKKSRKYESSSEDESSSSESEKEEKRRSKSKSKSKKKSQKSSKRDSDNESEEDDVMSVIKMASRK